MLKKTLAGLFIVLVLAGLGGYLWWQRHTALPDWYSEGSLDDEGPPLRAGDGLVWIPIDEEPSDGRERANPPSPAKPKKTSRRSKRYEMRGFHRHRRAKSAPKVIKASRATLEGSRLEAGVVLDLSALPTDKLSKRDRELYRKALAAFPSLAERDIYVAIEDDVLERDGVIQLGADPKVRIGKARYDLDTVARKLGMRPEQLRDELDRELRRMNVQAP